LHGTITPNGLVFERHHAGFPSIPPQDHHLMLHGMVDRPLIFTMDDILRFPSESKVYFLECSGNTALELKKPTGISAQDTHGMVSCCEWTGVRLSALLQEAGIQKQATWLLAEGADAAAMTRSIPMAKALDDALLVYAQNGEMLRPEQGYPLRLFLPGFEGNMSVKWLRRLKLGDAPWQSREETSAYTDLMPDGSAMQFTFHMEVKSVVTSPSGGQTIQRSGFYEIQGLAWSGRGKIRRVEVSADGGKTWQDAVLQEPIQSKALVRFRLPWQWQGQAALLQSRATDELGNVQPSRSQIIAEKGMNFYYHNNSIQTWQVSAQGEVRNVHA
jgi:sulfane dehydrogenase subunit SoxC